MTIVPEILKEFNESNSTLHKIEVMKKYKDHGLFLDVFRKANDKVKYTFGISLKNVPDVVREKNHQYEMIDLPTALGLLDDLSDRKVTGNDAMNHLTDILQRTFYDDEDVIRKIIDRDLKINFGKRQYNKIVSKEWKCISIPYMRCGVYSKKTASKISFPAFVQLKADGRFCEVNVSNGKVSFTSRSGEEDSFPHLEKHFLLFPDGVYHGELLVGGQSNRALANGIINSDDVEAQKDVYIQLWDYITQEEYANSKGDNTTRYEDRFKTLYDILDEASFDDILPIQCLQVYNIQEALEQTSVWMNDGYEGSILKDFGNIFKDHTSLTQLKLKITIEVDVRITGFSEGKKGTKRAKTFGAMMFANDDGSIQGKTSGFSDKQLKDFNSRREELIGAIITVECNDITKGQKNDFHALSHPRFIELREDKDNCDTLERAMELKQLAMEMKG